MLCPPNVENNDNNDWDYEDDPPNEGEPTLNTDLNPNQNDNGGPNP